MASTYSQDSKLKLAPNQLWSLLDAADAGIGVLDANGNLLRFNRGWECFIAKIPELEELTLVGSHMPDIFRELAASLNHRGLQRLANSIDQISEAAVEKLDVAIDIANGDVFMVSVAQSDTSEPCIVLTARDHSAVRSLEQQLEEATRQAGAAEMATGVLHNVGNVLNSVNISAKIIQRKLEDSAIASFEKLRSIVEENEEDFAVFVAEDKRGQLLPRYIQRLGMTLDQEQSEMKAEIENLTKNIEHIKEIVSVQQSYAKLAGCSQEIDMRQVIDDALTAVNGSIINHKIDLHLNIESIPPIETDKHKLLQILVNLVTNAKDALSGHENEFPRIDINAFRNQDSLVVEVKDNGMGITHENIAKIFQHGFTTKKTGHGFGLHSCSISAKQLGGNLEFESDGPGCGATFRLTLPLSPNG